MNLKLTKSSVREAKGLIPTDMVFYKDKDGKLYRLRYLKSRFEESMSEVQKLTIYACISKYAPDILEGEIVEDNPDEVHVIAESGIYILQKNAEKIEYWDTSEEYPLRSDP
jgi:hypothetical protein